MHYYTRFKNHEHSYQVCEQALLCTLIMSDVSNGTSVIMLLNLKLAPACNQVPAQLPYKHVISWQLDVESLL